MKTEIDWSKAPEGATHYLPEDDKWENCWAKIVGNDVFLMLDDGMDDQWDMAIEPASNMHTMISRPSGWTGTGLPPVWTVCEMQHEDWNRGWEKVLVLYTSSAYVITSDAKSGEQHWYTRNLSFRPIRTPEQIAAEERESAIRQMVKDARPMNRREVCADLYDAGYRKQEQPK